MVFVFFCLAEAVKFFTLYLVRLNITVPIHLPIFSDSSPNCLWGFHMERSWNCFHHFTHAPQKTINVYGFVYGFGVAFMVFWGARLWFFGGGGVYGFLGVRLWFWGRRLWFFWGGVYGFRGGGRLWFCGGVYTCGEGVSGFCGQSVYGFRGGRLWFWAGAFMVGGAFMVFLWFWGAAFMVLRGGRLWFSWGAFMVFWGGVYGFRWRPLWFSRGWLMVLVCWREVGFASLPLCGGEVEVEVWVVRPFQKGSLGLSFWGEQGVMSLLAGGRAWDRSVETKRTRALWSQSQ